MPKTVWLAIVWEDESGELDATLHDREEDAQCAVCNELHELYGELFNDDPPPDEYDEELIAEWLSDNLLRFNWAVRPKTLAD